MDQVFVVKNESKFLPAAEKYFEPMVARFAGNPMDKLPLDDLLSQSPESNLLLPGALKGLLGEGSSGILEQAGQFKPEAIKQQMEQIIGKPPPDQAQKTDDQQYTSSYQKALDILDVDTTNQMNVQDLLKRLKKK